MDLFVEELDLGHAFVIFIFSLELWDQIPARDSEEASE
jgi:hypothetical protein